MFKQIRLLEWLHKLLWKLHNNWHHDCTIVIMVQQQQHQSFFSNFIPKDQALLIMFKLKHSSTAKDRNFNKTNFTNDCVLYVKSIFTAVNSWRHATVHSFTLVTQSTQWCCVFKYEELYIYSNMTSKWCSKSNTGADRHEIQQISGKLRIQVAIKVAQCARMFNPARDQYYVQHVICNVTSHGLKIICRYSIYWWRTVWPSIWSPLTNMSCHLPRLWTMSFYDRAGPLRFFFHE